MVGPFIFFDHVGPAEFITGTASHVRPHPHIGLGTVTYLYRGEFQHRDSLGTNQVIHPARSTGWWPGMAWQHSERTSAPTRKKPGLAVTAFRRGWPCPTTPRMRAFVRAPWQGSLAGPGEGASGLALDPRPGLRQSRPGQHGLGDVLRGHRDGGGRRPPLAPITRIRGVYSHRGRDHRRGTELSVQSDDGLPSGDRVTLKAGEQGAEIMILGGETFPPLATSGGTSWPPAASGSSGPRRTGAPADADGRLALLPDDRGEFIPLPGGGSEVASTPRL